MPFQAPFKVGTGANCGDGAGEEVGEGVPPSSRSQGLVEKILEQSLKKVGGKKKKNDPQNAGAKPRIDPPIFSRSPVKMKKVTMRGKRTKPSYMSDDEGDLGEQSCAPAEKRGAPAELVGGDELVGGEQEDTFMRSCSQLFAISIFNVSRIYSNVSRRLDRAAWQESEDHAVEGENVVVEREKPWLGESQVLLKSKLTIE